MFVMRARGYYYQNGREIVRIDWLTKDGHITSRYADRMIYANEDDAWLHAAACDILGADESGDWAWPEEDKEPINENQ